MARHFGWVLATSLIIGGVGAFFLTRGAGWGWILIAVALVKYVG